MLSLSDFRGNDYEYGEDLGGSCDEPGCDKNAVRLPCNAEGDLGRTHWHGGIHRLDMRPGSKFCEEHGLMHLTKNQEIRGC